MENTIMKWSIYIFQKGAWRKVHHCTEKIAVSEYWHIIPFMNCDTISPKNCFTTCIHMPNKEIIRELSLANKHICLSAVNKNCLFTSICSWTKNHVYTLCAKKEREDELLTQYRHLIYSLVNITHIYACSSSFYTT